MESKAMKSAVAVLGLAATVFALPAAAQMNTSAFYVGGSIGQSKFKNACTGLPAGLSCDEKDTAWRVLGGYQFNPNIAAELGYHNFGETKATGSGFEVKDKAKAWELVAVGMWPIANQFGIYGKLGGHHSESTIESNLTGVGGKNTGNGLTFGAGLQWDVTPPLGLRAEWQRYQRLGGVSDNKLDVLSLGAVWRFR
jgi:opacity protein-like surface antigen